MAKTLEKQLADFEKLKDKYEFLQFQYEMAFMQGNRFQVNRLEKQLLGMKTEIEQTSAELNRLMAERGEIL